MIKLELVKFTPLIQANLYTHAQILVLIYQK